MPDPAGAALLHEFFDARWREWCDRPAIDIPPGSARPLRVVATYADVALASRAIEDRVRPLTRLESIVAVLLPRQTVAAFAAPIGILRAGAAFTSIDVSFPDARVADLLNDAAAVAVVTDRAGADRLTRLGITLDRIVNIDRIGAASAGAPASPSPSEATSTPPPGLTSSSLAYVIYTSGTTGVPKGVMIEHRAIANLVRSDLAEFGVRAGDRVAQNSSHAYDSSIEEIWLAFAAGATLVVMDDDVARAGPDLVPWLERESITVFCPTPTMLRATGCRDARGRLPHLRLLYTGGEALTADLVAAWAPGRRLSNGYGPTETAVTSIRGDVTAGQPVTIGHPITHVTAWVLDDALDEVPDGGTGELCLGGVCLARGYWRDPALTARKFPVHPLHGRLYRTGDRATRAGDGTLRCLGRVDSQVKIRGYRIELEEIESRLAAADGVREAACRVQGDAARPTLAAFVVATDPATPPDLDRLRRDLAVALPAHLVPSLLHILPALPRTTGGKLDRQALPDISAGIGDEERRPIVAPRSDLEVRIERALRRVARRSSPVSVTDNFFQDLGGDSLLAAHLITALRDDATTAGLTVRDTYEAPTIERLARRARPLAGAPATERPRPEPGGMPGLATLIQVTWLVAELVVMSAAAYAAASAVWAWASPWATPLHVAIGFPVIGFAALFLYLVLSLLLAVLAKRLLIGSYVPCRWPVWGRLYIRHWAVCQVVRIVPWRLIDGTVFQLAALRALGARIGRRVHIHRGVDLLQGGWDLLEIGDDVTIGQEVTIRLVDFEDEHVVVGPVVIGEGATLDIRASIAGGAHIGREGYLTALSSLPAGASIPDHECWDGVPAAAAGPSPAAPELDSAATVLSPMRHGVVMLLTRMAGSLAAPTIGLAALAWVASWRQIGVGDVLTWLRTPSWRPEVLWLIAASVAIVPLSVIGQLIAIRLLGRLPPGVISRWSPTYLRVWVKSDLVRRAGDWLSGTLLWPMWLRAAGMRIGPDCEISTIIDVVPELVSIGDSTFFADGVYLGGPRLHRGTVTLAATRLGSEVFIGNHVVIPAGSEVGDGVLIGVSTVAGVEASRPRSSWFGHPPFALTRPPVDPADRRLTHDPSPIRRINRWIWEIGRFGIPAVTLGVFIGAAGVFFRAQPHVTATWMAVVITPAVMTAVGLALCGVVLALKWLLLGRVRPGRHPLWSCWCSRWDFLYVAWGRLARPILARFDGTLLLAWFLRATGMRIGRRVVLGPGFGQVVDPDMIEIEDGATVHALFQAHTFEDRMLKIDRVRIGAHATVGCGTVLFYGADIGEGASVAAQSVVMKHERLTPHQRYEGCPCADVRT